jgi:hypothetical protein
VRFTNAFGTLLDSCTSEQQYGAQPRLFAKPGLESEAARLAFEVDRLAGPAAQALASIPLWVDFKPRGTMRTTPVNPIVGWRTVFEDDPMFGPDMIIAMAQQGIGTLETRALEAEESEHSMEARVGKIVGFMDRARLHGGSRRRTSMGMLGTFVVGVAVTLVGAYLAYRFGWVGGD